MEQFEDFFKNREEVEAYFKNQMFRFNQMIDDIMFFESLEHTEIDGEYVCFVVTMYYQKGETFFNYSGFKGWLSNFQLCEVECESLHTGERVSMYFNEKQ